MRSATRPGVTSWWAVTIGGGALTAGLLVGPAGEVTWRSTTALFVIVLIAAGLCVVGSLSLLVAAHRRDLAEAGVFAAGLSVISILPMVHGLTAPGVLYGPNEAVTSSVFVALPLAVAAMSPLGLPSSAATRWIGRRWRWWAGGWIVAATLTAVLLLVRPDAITVGGRAAPLTWAVTAFGLSGVLWLSRTQLRLYWIGERRATLVASVGLLLLALTSLVWIGTQPFSIGWWFVHALDLAGVGAGVVGAWVAHRTRRPVLDTLAPVVTRDPLHTLELGLSPVVHRFVEALELKDPITRDHVVRTAELAIRVGEHLALAPRRIRYLGLGALLHDIGKIEVPDEILNKPGRLTDEEYVAIQRHTEVGDSILRSVDSLAPAASFVRAHHERLDGGGYPDGLAGDDIPLEARVIAACDAYDAMAHTRQYRMGMGHERAVAILREHAGSQWDPNVVEALIATLEDLDIERPSGPALDAVGRTPVACDCADALPDSIRRQLVDSRA